MKTVLWHLLFASALLTGWAQDTPAAIDSVSVVLLTLREEDPLDESAQAALARMAQEGRLESIRRWANDHRFGVCEMGSRELVLYSNRFIERFTGPYDTLIRFFNDRKTIELHTLDAKELKP